MIKKVKPLTICALHGEEWSKMVEIRQTSKQRQIAYFKLAKYRYPPLATNSIFFASKFSLLFVSDALAKSNRFYAKEISLFFVSDALATNSIFIASVFYATFG